VSAMVSADRERVQRWLWLLDRPPFVRQGGVYK
jgi:hypothetical protein